MSEPTVITKLRQAGVEWSRGLRTPQVGKKLGVSEQTYSQGPSVRQLGWRS